MVTVSTLGGKIGTGVFGVGNNLQKDLRRARAALELHTRVAKEGRFFHAPHEVAAALHEQIEQSV